MKTMNHEVPQHLPRRTAAPADRKRAHRANRRSHAVLAKPFPLHVIPWIIPGLAVLLVLMTGVIWATVL
jgi:hypothetical protein